MKIEAIIVTVFFFFILNGWNHQKKETERTANVTRKIDYQKKGTVNVTKDTDVGSKGAENDAEKAALAKEALIRLMRSDKRAFEGADPNRFAAIEIKKDKESGEYIFGCFRINLEKKYYNCDVDFGVHVNFYHGIFEVNDKGKWEVKEPTVMRAYKPLEKKE